MEDVKLYNHLLLQEFLPTYLPHGQFVHHDLELIQYCELKNLMELLLMVMNFQFEVQHQFPNIQYHQRLSCLDVKYNVFHHPCNVIMQVARYDLDHIQ